MAEGDPNDPLDDNTGEPPAGSLPPARNKAMDWLAYREHSVGELRAKFADRGYPDDLIDEAISALLADGLVSDERFAESFIGSRIRKGQGPVRIRMELKKRGVASDIIRLYLDDAGFDWAALAGEVRSRKFAGPIPEDFKDKARQMRFLEYRGFSSEQIRAALKEF